MVSRASRRGGPFLAVCLAAMTSCSAAPGEDELIRIQIRRAYAAGRLDGFEEGFEAGKEIEKASGWIRIPLWQGPQPTELPPDGERKDVL